MSKLNQLLSFNKRRRGSGAGKNPKIGMKILIGVLCSVLLIISVGIIGVSAVKFGSGVTIASASPTQFIRIQIVNATGGNRSELFELTEKIKRLSDSLVEITVVEHSDFMTRTVDQSLIISREKDLSSAKYLAGKLGIDPKQIEYNKMEINSRQVTITLVVGQDIISGLKSVSGKKGIK